MGTLQEDGTAVILGLVNRPELNMRIVRLLTLDESANRWAVLVWLDHEHQERVRVKPDNLRVTWPIVKLLIQPGLEQVTMRFEDVRHDLFRMTRGMDAQQIEYNLQAGLYLTTDATNFTNVPDGFRTPIGIVQADVWAQQVESMCRMNGLGVDDTVPVRVLPPNRFFNWNGFEMDDNNPPLVQYYRFYVPDDDSCDTRQTLLPQVLTDTHGLEPVIFVYAKIFTLQQHSRM